MIHALLSKHKGNTISGEKIKFYDFITPYHLSLNVEEKYITVKKRNWFLVGVDTKIFNFGQVRNILIDENLILADLKIKVYAGIIECYWFRKKDVLNFNKSLRLVRQKGQDIGFIID